MAAAAPLSFSSSSNVVNHSLSTTGSSPSAASSLSGQARTLQARAPNLTAGEIQALQNELFAAYDTGPTIRLSESLSETQLREDGEALWLAVRPVFVVLRDQLSALSGSNERLSDEQMSQVVQSFAAMDTALDKLRKNYPRLSRIASRFRGQ
ncbi:MAG: hypothetical protein M1829_006202 [Trizodia sp. TS-e1964]|nr:MAG: hypothetical protein M1829_006202 [Trizodia sp. TS-e1964]